MNTAAKTHRNATLSCPKHIRQAAPNRKLEKHTCCRRPEAGFMMFGNAEQDVDYSLAIFSSTGEARMRCSKMGVLISSPPVCRFEFDDTRPLRQNSKARVA